MNMLKFLCYKVQLIIQNNGNMINYNHSLTHGFDSQVTWGCNLKCDDVSTTTTIIGKNN